MTERVVLAVVLVAVAVAVALVLQRRRPAPPTQPRAQVPALVDRADMPGADHPWLVAVFTSRTCDSCARVTAKAAVLASAEVAYAEVPWQDRRDLHERYGITIVPTTLVADADGVVRASFVGVPTATDLWAAVAEARAPGSTPEPDLGRPHAEPEGG